MYRSGSRGFDSLEHGSGLLVVRGADTHRVREGVDTVVDTLLRHIAVLSLSVCLIETTGLHLSMGKGVHVHHSVGGLGFGLTVAALIILLSLLKHHAECLIDNGTPLVA